MAATGAKSGRGSNCLRPASECWIYKRSRAIELELEREKPKLIAGDTRNLEETGIDRGS
jgi:hypothetical protein